MTIKGNDQLREEVQGGLGCCSNSGGSNAVSHLWCWRVLEQRQEAVSRLRITLQQSQNKYTPRINPLFNISVKTESWVLDLS